MSPLDRIRVVLSHTSHPGNIGAVARAMKTMGLSRLVLVNPKIYPDEQADVRAAGATDILAAAQVVTSLSEALVGTVLAVAMSARRRELAVPPVWAREAAAELVAAAATGEVALVFGNETAGLSNEELLQCRRWAMIPVNPAFSSLNVAAAVQVMCYELRLAGEVTGLPPAVSGAGLPANHEEVEHLVAHIERAALGSGFLDPANPKRLVLRMRRLFSRAVIEKEEVNILRGLLAALEKRS
ncbi:MAG: RNA methyltransferase [Rugosibacter sp.]|jgi:tRNA/rRNA methyltransferase|nr:RNA methyltransferase [Rugosibacter sp.]MDO9272828.1 RNA methyltransferase [Rugosibacter sp.]